MRTAVLLALALSGCKKDPPDRDSATTDDAIDCSVKTDTVPQFCGQVPTNLLFISIDTFRKDLLARYGGDPALTPTLDRLAREGVVLDNHLQCANWTFHSTTCTLMGQTPETQGWMPRLADAEPVPPGLKLFPGYMRDLGYWSALASSNAWLSNSWGNGRDYNRVIFPAGGKFPAVANNGLNALYDAQALGLADKWFLHLHALEPHAPYNPDPAYLDGLADLDPIPWNLTEQTYHYQTLSLWPTMTPEEQALLLAHMTVRYHGEVMSTDDGIDAVLQDMDAAGLLDDTLVVVWTDHGEAFWEHGKQTHAHYLYREENDAIAIFWAKNIVPEVRTDPTQAHDIVPTLLRLYGAEIPPEMDGIPLGDAPPDRARFTASDAREGTMQAVEKEGWRLQFHWRDGSLILTHPAEDPLEAPLDHDTYADKVNELWALLEPRAEMVAQIKGYGPASWPTLP